MSNRLPDIYHILFNHFGPQYWWPGDSPFEVMVGALLTQNTNWSNVSRAISNLKKNNLLSFDALETLPVEVLAKLIRPSGYYNIKAARLKNLLAFIRKNGGNLESLFNEETTQLRERLLAVKGIGPETADSILLYAAQKPVFVVDAYTHRILVRHGLISEEATYYEIQELFINSLPEDILLYNEYHALLVRLGKAFCKKSNPQCNGCPLEDY